MFNKFKVVITFLDKGKRPWTKSFYNEHAMNNYINMVTPHAETINVTPL